MFWIHLFLIFSLDCNRKLFIKIHILTTTFASIEESVIPLFSDYRRSRQRAAHPGRRRNSPEEKRVGNTGLVRQRWRCDGVLLRMVEEHQPRLLWQINVQIREGLQLPPVAYVLIQLRSF